ncbi:MAG: hypothetical protein K2P14_10430 [Anaeroplasmataceae bacterium]|nr:hypothetical protein [Anaeroplasmataceae bacterium]
MANPFLNDVTRDIETAIMLEQVIVYDIGNAVAYTDGNRVFINTDDNLYKILPAYNHQMLKWLLWHERYHMELRHHNRFFRFLAELNEDETKDKFHLTKQEVNIIMDILVHDSLSKMFPELVETATTNLAQMRNRNSLNYTFKTFTLEEMLNEYKDYKKDDKESEGGDGESEDEKEDSKEGEDEDTPKSKGKGKDKDSEKKSDDKKDDDSTGKTDKKGHSEGGKSDGSDSKEEKAEDGAPDIKEEQERPESEPLSDEHDKTDWSKLKEISDEEFIDKDDGDYIVRKVNELKHKKFRLAKLTETLNGLATTTRRRSYAMPSTVSCGKGILLKGSQPGKTLLYLCFDASGSMTREMNTFKDIISKSIPHAMHCPCEWFAGSEPRIAPYKREGYDSYYKGQFSDFMDVDANNGYNDDGDRTIELCWKAEQAGFTPIGITDGGGQIGWSIDQIRELKRTVLVGQNKKWLEEVRKINPKIQILDI